MAVSTSLQEHTEERSGTSVSHVGLLSETMAISKDTSRVIIVDVCIMTKRKTG